MDFQDNITIFYQADPIFGAKLRSSFANLAKNTGVYSSRLVLYKASFHTYSRFKKTGTGILYGFIVQSHSFRPRQSKIRSRIGQFCGYSDQKDICLWLQTSVILFQSQYSFMSKIHQALDWSHKWVSSPVLATLTKPIHIFQDN